MPHEIRRKWIKKSPCSGCWCLDAGSEPVEYCSSVTDFDRFCESRYGVKIGKQRLYRNCPHKNYG